MEQTTMIKKELAVVEYVYGRMLSALLGLEHDAVYETVIKALEGRPLGPSEADVFENMGEVSLTWGSSGDCPDEVIVDYEGTPAFMEIMDKAINEATIAFTPITLEELVSTVMQLEDTIAELRSDEPFTKAGFTYPVNYVKKIADDLEVELLLYQARLDNTKGEEEA